MLATLVANSSLNMKKASVVSTSFLIGDFDVIPQRPRAQYAVLIWSDKDN
jgi:hypothetical protein